MVVLEILCSSEIRMFLYCIEYYVFSVQPDAKQRGILVKILLHI